MKTTKLSDLIDLTEIRELGLKGFDLHRLNTPFLDADVNTLMVISDYLRIPVRELFTILVDRWLNIKP